MDASVPGILTLAEWRRRIAELYAAVRADPEAAYGPNGIMLSSIR